MSLLELQQDFRAWLAEASDEAAERFGEAARPGLSVYQNNYRAALTACLSDTFMVFVHGERQLLRVMMRPRCRVRQSVLVM